MSWKKDNRYGTYTGPRGTATEARAAFDAAFQNSDAIKSIATANIKERAFTVFNLLPSASEDDIKREFRLRLKKVGHPDTGGDRTEFQRLVDAYQILMGKFRRGLDLVPTPRTPRAPRREVDPDDVAQPQPSQSTDEPLIIPQLLTEIKASQLESYLFDDAWGAQEKKDGRHLTLQIKNSTQISTQFIVRNKKGDMSNCAPEFESSLRAIGKDVLIDGEHIGNIFWTWDILELNGTDLRGLGYQERYNLLLKINFGPSIKVLKLVIGSRDKKFLFEKLAPKKEGIVFKQLAAPFSEGKGEDQVKYKFYAEASVIVVAGRPGKASIGMELINAAGTREFVGFCTCVLNPLPTIGSVAEIKYLYVANVGGCLYQPAFKELRDDVSIGECTTAQLKYKSSDEE